MGVRGLQRQGQAAFRRRHYDTWPLSVCHGAAFGSWRPTTVRCCCGRCGQIPCALEVIKAWGFEYQDGRISLGEDDTERELITLDGKGLHWGDGLSRPRANTEPCLLATRGEPRRLSADVHQVVIAPVGEHSEKPDEVYRRIERLYPGPYLELFARKPRDRWRDWGNELPPLALGS